MTTSRRALTALATGALTLPLLSVPAAYAVEPEPPAEQSITAVCANVPASYNPFTDDEPNTFTAAIECVAFAGITQGGPGGLPSDQYGPALSVRRDQMASFIARLIDTADSLDTGTRVKALPAYDGSNAFTDVPAGNTHLQAINRLEAAGIVEGGPGGRSPNQYGPELAVTRAQMASFINRAIAFMKGGDPATAGTSSGYTSNNDYFTDDESFQAHERNINGIASRGIAIGDGRDTYRPGQAIQRDQMAGFLGRTLGALHQDGDIRPIGGRISVTPDETTSLVAVANPDQSTADDRQFTATGLDNGKTYRITLVKSENVRREANGTITFRGEADSGSSTGFSAVTGAPTADITRVNGTAVADADTTAAGQQSGTTTATPTNGSITFTVDGDGAAETVVPVVYVNGGPGQSAGNGGTSPRLEVRSSTAGAFGEPVESFDIGGTTTYNGTTARTVTTRPELVSATVGATRTVEGTIPGTNQDDRQLTDVTFTFDEPLTGKVPTAAAFHLVGFDSATRYNGSSAVIQQDQKVVVVTFGAAQTNSSPGASVGANELRGVALATVDFDAVRDNAGNANPIGAAAVGATRTDGPPAAGVTAAPDLVSVAVSTTTPASATSTPVEFRFDQEAFVVSRTGFKLVLTAGGPPVTCTAQAGATNGQPEAGQEDQVDETILADCPDGGQDDTITSGEIARGYVDPATVSNAEQDPANNVPQPTVEGDPNPLQASNTPDVETVVTAGGPHLVSASFSAGDAQNDQVTYVFSEAVLVDDAAASGTTDPDGAPPSGAQNGGQLDFKVYDTSGRETSASMVTRPQQDTTVIATFPDGTLRNAVGASVREAAVRAVSGDARINRADEEGVQNQSAPTTSESGRTDGPDLLAVAVAESGEAVYTFDEPVATDNQLQSGNVVEASFLLYLSDGTRLRCDTATVGTGAAANQVTCTRFTVLDVAEPGTATSAQVRSAVLGTVDDGAVRDTEAPTSNANPEGARTTVGSSGTPTA